MKKDIVTIFRYGRFETMERQAAIKKYAKAVMACDCAEKCRYANILADLSSGASNCVDDEGEYEAYMKQLTRETTNF